MHFKIPSSEGPSNPFHYPTSHRNNIIRKTANHIIIIIIRMIICSRNKHTQHRSMDAFLNQDVLKYRFTSIRQKLHSHKFASIEWLITSAEAPDQTPERQISSIHQLLLASPSYGWSLFPQHCRSALMHLAAFKRSERFDKRKKKPWSGSWKEERGGNDLQGSD